MTKEHIEFLLYIGSHSEIISWLKQQGCKTQMEAREKLQPFVKSNILDVSRNIGTSLAGTTNAVYHILKHFKYE